MGHRTRHQGTAASTAMRSRVGSQQAALSTSDMWTPPLKRSRTSLPAGPTRMYPSYSTPLAFSFGLGSVAEQQPGNAPVSFLGPQTLASPASYFAAGNQGVSVYEDAIDPADFLQARGYSPDRPLPASFATSGSLPYATPTFGDFDRLQHRVAAPSLLSVDSMTDAMTLETNSSGQVGNPYGGSPTLSFQMVHSNSQSSFMESPSYEGAVGLFDKSSANDTDLRYTGLMHTNSFLPAASAGFGVDVPQTMPYMGRSLSSQSDLAMPAMPQPFGDSLAQPLFAAEDMRRGPSNTSSRSTSSRLKSSLHRHIDNAKTPLQPKTMPDEVGKSANPQSLPDATSSMPDSARRMEVIRAKPEQRHKMPRLFCDQCTTSPSGFRGEHELRRHQLNKHSSTPKRWICCDPRDVGKTSSYQPFQPLADCRKCRLKRRYAQDYNAAEHLRRVHFTPKAQRKGCKNTSSRSKQGAYGVVAGSHRRPEDQVMVPMDELKKWMKEVDDPADANGQDSNDDCGFDTPDSTEHGRGASSHGQGNAHSTGQGTGNGSDHGSGCSNGSDASDNQYIISQEIGSYQSPRVCPWEPKDAFDEKTLGILTCYDVGSPSDAQRSGFLDDNDEASQSPAFPVDIDPSYFFGG